MLRSRCRPSWTGAPATRPGAAGTVVATFKDDGYSAFKEITRDGFGELIAAIEAGAVDVVIVRDIDRLTRNLTDWNAFEKACVRHGVRLSAYTGGDLDLSTAEGAYYGGMETLRARRESAVKSFRVREAQDREARKGRRTGGGQRWFGYTRIYATRTSRIIRSGTSCGRRSTRSRPRRSGTRRYGCWSTGNRSRRSRGTGPPAASHRSRPGSGGRPRSWAR
jgi:DNA invertase Pin-like site-specific DNA recombinase